ncbi:MAG: carbonic anhydrase [Nannocystales bacterium]
MSDITDQLIARNANYARTHEPRAPLPTLNTIVVSCVDARVDPAHLLGLTSGEAVVLRNAGGRVTEAVEQDIGLLCAMASKAMGRPADPEIVLIHHTQCGVELLCKEEVVEGLSRATSIAPEVLKDRAISDHEASLRRDVERLSASEHVPSGPKVSAMRYDQTSGHIELLFSEVL